MVAANILLFLGGLGGTEIVLIVLAILLFFGAKRIPELAKGLGRGIREFKDASKDIKQDIEVSLTEREESQPVETETRLRA
ncbi:Sec-independent protein translocase subunit TatA/TatB [Pontibacter fetidus]|uniref:Sec-independent protein translocase protein TatA n=1 Tax=Pontibacter fetidus TaxID=2700082 RepID=A0A6B2GX90_9BACT|nr:twin-arginine translocase TatA/TatE family subunit [Pontibacter fetidus]NDK55559.1 twin-arginine translocase TatA/TatE family subunit [Pontibacter fetidus]